MAAIWQKSHFASIPHLAFPVSWKALLYFVQDDNAKVTKIFEAEEAQVLGCGNSLWWVVWLEYLALFFVFYPVEDFVVWHWLRHRIDAFDLWCWRNLLRVPWSARRSNQSILKEISPEYSLGGLMLKLKLQYFGHLMPRADSLEKTLMLGEIEGRRRKGPTEDEMVGWHHWLNGHELQQTPGDSGGQRRLAGCNLWRLKEMDMTYQITTSENRQSKLG